MLFAVGDVLAQTVTMEKGGKYDRPRITRAAIYGTFIMGPLAHLHFNFMEWLIVKKVCTRLSRTCTCLSGLTLLTVPGFVPSLLSCLGDLVVRATGMQAGDHRFKYTQAQLCSLGD